MTDFMIRFGICNLFLCGIIGILLLARRLFKNSLSSHMQYHLWFLLLGLLTVPFLPFRLFKLPQIILWFQNLSISPISKTEHTIKNAINESPTVSSAWMEDFTLSVDHQTTTFIGWFLFVIWLSGILTTLIILAKSVLRLRDLKKTSVLNILKSSDYMAYGNTLLHFAEKISLTPFPFASGISGNMKQMKRRIMNIASYEKPTLKKRLKGIVAFLLTSVLLFGLAPFVSTYAADETHYQQNVSQKNVSKIDFSDYFGEYEGCFVLYDLKNNAWKIHDKERASLRVAPNSTYKIYSALFGLENDIITPESSLIQWNGENYPFEAWNKDQTLQSAMTSSVNWYFQSIDEQLGAGSIQNHLQKIGYGNENLNGDFSSYWMESSLKISPIEQVELLTKLYNNDLGFEPKNIKAVKDSIHIASSDTGDFYGKTGTGRVKGQDVNGWFIGFVERADNTYFFASNIHAKDHADGSTAAKIAMTILSDMSIWK